MHMEDTMAKTAGDFVRIKEIFSQIDELDIHERHGGRRPKMVWYHGLVNLPIVILPTYRLDSRQLTDYIFTNLPIHSIITVR